MADAGHIVISDITGYTEFLSQSELEHAEDSLRSLLNLLLEHTRPPLIVSRLEGDAVISYALDGSFLQGQTLVETLESTYVAYRQALQRMVLNTTCTCNACRNIPNLDLKFFVHYGSFMLQELANYTELIGSDVNLVHRLTKNTITEKTGLKAYGVYTEAAVEALGIGDLCGRMIRHAEEYEHLGMTSIFVQDLQEVWERERDRQRVVVEAEDAVFTSEYDFPYPRALLWDYLTKPEYRAILMDSDSQTVEARSDGRVGAGSIYYCAHGETVYPQTIVDWEPFEQMTIQVASPIPKVDGLYTVRLSSAESGTRATMLVSKSRGPLLLRKANDLAMPFFLKRDDLTKGCRALHDRIEQDIAEGKVVQPAPTDVSTEQVAEAVAKSLTA